MRNRELARHVGQEVRVALVRRGMTQRQLAESLGMTPNTLSAKITGMRPFDLDELADIEHVLGVPLAELLPIPAGSPEPATA